MAAPKLSNHDQKDLDKFTKYLIYKCIQVIVQSRLGEKVRTQSKPVSSGSDWVIYIARLFTAEWAGLNDGLFRWTIVTLPSVLSTVCIAQN